MIFAQSSFLQLPHSEVSQSEGHDINLSLGWLIELHPIHFGIDKFLCFMNFNG
jgi:hypothetical protein